MLCILSFKNPNGENLKVLHIIFKRYCLIKTIMRKSERKLIRKRVRSDMSLKTPLKPNGKNIRRNWHDICEHLYQYIVSLKTFYEKPWGKTHEGKKSTIYAIWWLLTGIVWEITPSELRKSQGCLIPISLTCHDIVNNLLDFHIILFDIISSLSIICEDN